MHLLRHRLGAAPPDCAVKRGPAANRRFAAGPDFFMEALNKLARAGSVRFFVRQKNGKQGNTVCISCFSFCVDGEKDKLSSRRRFIQSFLICPTLAKPEPEDSAGQSPPGHCGGASAAPRRGDSAGKACGTSYLFPLHYSLKNLPLSTWVRTLGKCLL